MNEESKKSVLVVEDDGILSKTLSSALKEAGYEVLAAEDGKEGLEMALAKHPDIILLDIIMPVMDGFEMLKELRKDEWGKGVYVIILTNKDPSNDLIEEANQTPYRSEYLIKSDQDINHIVDLVGKRLAA